MVSSGRPVAFLGPEGTFTHAAALRLAPDATLVAMPTLAAVYAFVSTGEGFGVVPIENSVEGYVVPSLDLLLGSADLLAVAEAAESISFNAFRLRDDSSSITGVLSHPHALAQCKKFIDSLAVPTKETGSTAAACTTITRGQVAIAAALCADLYDLDVMRTAVEDFTGAKTRFLLLGHRTFVSPGEVPSDAPVQSFLAVTPAHAGPGVLAGVLEHFAAATINLSSLVTRPLHAQSSRYSFVITADSHSGDPAMQTAINGILRDGHYVRLMGVYRPSDYDMAVSERVQSGIPAGSVSQSDGAAIAAHMGW